MAERHIHLVVDDIDPGALSADDLPTGHSYVDDLQVGTAFRFLDAGRATCRHVLNQRGPTGRFAPRLIQVHATGQTCGAAAYLLHEATIVRVEA